MLSQCSFTKESCSSVNVVVVHELAVRVRDVTMTTCLVLLESLIVSAQTLKPSIFHFSICLISKTIDAVK